jgi:hypothetical protein
MRDGGGIGVRCSEEGELIFLGCSWAKFAEEWAECWGGWPSGEEAGGVARGAVIEGGGVKDGGEQVVGNEADVEVAGACQGDEDVTAFGEDQGVDAGGDEVVEQKTGVIGRGWRSQEMDLYMSMTLPVERVT